MASWAEYLSAWRDECVEERLGELMAAHDITRAERDRLLADRYRLLADCDALRTCANESGAECDRLRADLESERKGWEINYTLAVEDNDRLRAENEALRKTLLHNGYHAKGGES
jgi:hypothetical protein